MRTNEARAAAVRRREAELERQARRRRGWAAAVASFALSSALTLACVRLREQGWQSGTKDCEKAEPPSADQ